MLKKIKRTIFNAFRYGKFMGNIRRKFLSNTEFSIISNNCWGGRVYQRYNLEYTSPTIGLYFIADEYIKFLKNIKYYTSIELNIISIEQSKYREYLINTEYQGLVGKLDDVEVMLLHYTNEEEAINKWNRRCKRINWENLIVKFNDQNYCTYNNLKEFDELDFKNKICFTSKDYKEIKSNIFMKEYQLEKNVKDDVQKYIRYINLTKIINNI